MPSWSSFCLDAAEKAFLASSAALINMKPGPTTLFCNITAAGIDCVYSAELLSEREPGRVDVDCDDLRG